MSLICGSRRFTNQARLVKAGYNGCWLIALGTNDTADVYVGSALDLPGRIKEMMATIGNQPVVWLTAKTLRTSGPYNNANMKKWNQALLQAYHTLLMVG